MADIQYKDVSATLVNVIDDGASLGTTVRAAGDYDNDTSKFLWCIPKLTVQFDTTAPTALDAIADLYIIPGDGAASEVYAEGGDAGLGTNDTPQVSFYVGTFTTINPSTSTDEVLMLPMIPLYPHGNRFVLENVSGQTFDSTWQLDILPVKLTIV